MNFCRICVVSSYVTKTDHFSIVFIFQEYLKQFGYIDVSSGHAQAAQDITHSLKAFQKFAGLKVTGKFDQETVEKMKAPRCGDKDPLQYKSRRRRRYVLEGSVWKKKVKYLLKGRENEIFYYDKNSF